ncbi:NrtR DNA-binding winged helix domain-containing protein [Mycobacterium sp. SMC-4]|uniref:NrtR DNA-binding winged helix domain-containing protein n=1 Tax=Mycobacterium sp. SMC-4 TaxID=2857059 RepID=UPI003CFC4F1F
MTSAPAPSITCEPRYVDNPTRIGYCWFTIRELRFAHEQVAGRPLQRDWFRRVMEPQLIATGTVTSRGRGRRAELFRRPG